MTGKVVFFFVFNSRKYRIPTASPEGLKALGSGSRSNAGGTRPAAHLGGELLDHRLQVVAPLREGLVHAVRLQRGLSESTRGIRAQRLQKRARAAAPGIPEVTPPINLQSAVPTPQLFHGAAPATATAAPTHQQEAGLLQVRAGHGALWCGAVPPSRSLPPLLSVTAPGRRRALTPSLSRLPYRGGGCRLPWRRAGGFHA